MHDPIESSRSHRALRPRRGAFARIAAGVALLAALPVVIAARPEPAADPVAAPVAQADGQRVYSQTCSACHQTTGLGIPGAFPPLAGSEWVTGDKGRLVRIVMHGLTGLVTVAGEEYEGMMPPWGGTLGDPEIAAVATYVRSSWGNKADAVTAAEVTAIRQQSAGRSAPWTVEELMTASSPEK
jgi:mono/diheme cytochrome c family protein